MFFCLTGVYLCCRKHFFRSKILYPSCSNSVLSSELLPSALFLRNWNAGVCSTPINFTCKLVWFICLLRKLDMNLHWMYLLKNYPFAVDIFSFSHFCCHVSCCWFELSVKRVNFSKRKITYKSVMYESLNWAKFTGHYSCVLKVFFPVDQELSLKSHAIS